MQRARRLIAAPFGYLEQREAEWLRLRGARMPALALLVTIRVRADARPGGWTLDGIVSLAKWALMSPATTKRWLKWLVQTGVVELGALRPKRGGLQGEAWERPRRVRPFDLWPDEERISTNHSLREDRVGPDGRLDPPSEESGPARATSQTSYPDVYPDDVVGSKMVSAALTELANFAGYPFSEDEDRGLLLAFHRQRPGVDLVVETRRWIERAKRDEPRQPRAALRGWLLPAIDTPRGQRERLCAVPGCPGRGRGSLGLCMQHFLSAVERPPADKSATDPSERDA